MNQKESQYDDDFIGRWVSGSLSGEEQRELYIRMKSHPDEAKRFNELRSLWIAAGRLSIKPKTFEESSWDIIAKKLEVRSQTEPSNFTKSKSRNILLQTMSAAAIVLIMVGAYWWFTRPNIISVFTQRGESRSVTLPDNSEVTLNAESSIKYDENNFYRRRELKLTGEAFFKVEKTNIPFVVATDFTSTEVLGTSFNIKSRKKLVQIACVTGKVAVTSDMYPKKQVILLAGLASSITYGKLPSQPYRFDSKKSELWTKGEISFKSASVGDVIEELERQFNVYIRRQNSMDSISFTGSFNTKDLNAALDILSLSTGINHVMLNDSTVVMKQKD